MNNKTYLEHYGVKGMRWGFSLFGKKKKQQSNNRNNDKDEYESYTSEDHQRYERLKGKKVSELSNQDLQFLSRRAELESKYKQMNPSSIEKGMATVKKVTDYANTAYNAYTTAQKILGLFSSGKTANAKVNNLGSTSSVKSGFSDAALKRRIKDIPMTRPTMGK